MRNKDCYIVYLYLIIQHFYQICQSEEMEIHCVTDNTFAVHIKIFNQVIDTALVLYCPENHHCVSNSKIPCQQTPITSTWSSLPSPSTWSTTQPTRPEDDKRTTTTREPISTTSSPAPTTIPISPPECHASGYYPANKCNEYYECIPMFWWHTSVLRTCSEGYFFSEMKKPCSKPPNVVCYF